MIRRPPRSTLFPYPTLSRSLVLRHRRAQPGGEVVAQHLAGPDLLADVGMLRRHEVPESLLPRPDLVHRDVVEIAVGHGEDHHEDRKSTRLNSSHLVISYAVF